MKSQIDDAIGYDYRDYRGTRAALFDGIKECGIRASQYLSNEISEHDNDVAIEGLQDRVNISKSVTGDVHEEVESHNRLLDHMGDMDSSKGIPSGTEDRFKLFCVTYHLQTCPICKIKMLSTEWHGVT